MGGLCFMVGGHMCRGVDGLAGDALMVRPGKDGYAAALARPHTSPVELGGKRLGGFVYVDPAGFDDDAKLADWLRVSLDCVATLPTKGEVAGKPRRGKKVGATQKAPRAAGLRSSR